MENDKLNKQENENPIESYNPANRDFQRTGEDIDKISNSEKEELEIRKQRTHEASTTPDKNHIG